MTSAQGSGVRGSRRPSRSGFRAIYFSSTVLTACPPNWLRSAAFTLAANDSSCREAKRAKSASVIAGAGTRLVDRVEDRPAALAGVLDVAADLLQVRILLEREHEQVEQPAADDRAVLPERRDLVQVRA